MSWTVALASAVLNALITVVLAVAAGFFLMNVLNVHDRDGGVSMGIIFFVGPVALALGFLFGLAGAWWVGASGWPDLWKALGMGALIPNGITLMVVVVQLLGRPVTPTLDGVALDLEAEVVIPADMIAGEILRDPGSRASLYAGDRDNQYITVDTAGIRREGEEWVVPLRGGLNTVASFRMISFSPRGRASLVLDLRLAARPSEADTAWTELFPLRQGILPDGSHDLTPARARYRVVRRGAAGG